MTEHMTESTAGAVQTAIDVPADVPEQSKQTYIDNIMLVTQGKRRMMLFAGDQKIEHLNDDFASEEADPEDQDPEHLFKIASQAKISCFASQLELIARYGNQYPNVPYVVKMNSRTNFIPTSQKDPLSLAMVTMEQVDRFKQESGLNIVGVGYTLYLGSEFEAEMMREAQSIILEAHQRGLFTIIWMYPRGKAVPNELDPKVVAGACGVASAMGTDFVKVNFPKPVQNQGDSVSGPSDTFSVARAEALKEAVSAAGKTMVIVSGGSKMEERDFLQNLWNQIHISGAAGNATGRNMHQRSLEDAIKFADAIYAIVFEDAEVEEAVKKLE